MQENEAQIVQATPPSLNLLDTLTSCCHRLQQSFDDTSTKASVLAARQQALGVVDLFRQVLQQAPVDAEGLDFVGAAGWLAGWYHDQHKAASTITAVSGLVGSDGKPMSSTQHVPQSVVDSLGRSALMWNEVVNSWWMTPAEDLDFTFVGVMRIWTNVVAAVSTTLSSGRVSSRHEAVALTLLLSSTAREAAAMAEGLGVESHAGDDTKNCRFTGMRDQHTCAEEGCGWCQTAERVGDEATS